ncbi:MAG: alpha/beta fold hydrolase [Desulfobacterales bacterium]|nr:alpha/beta fold hydrolase [Desulfobacterales bacterium]
MALKRKSVFILVPLLFFLGLMSVYYFLPEAAFDLVIRVERGVGGLSENTVDAGNLHFAYLEGGRGEPLVLLHGFGANKDNWTRIGRHLTPHFRVIAPDLIGFGESGPAPDGNYAIRIQAERVRAFAMALGLESFHLGGSSMGGYIAGVYAAAYPQEIKSLLLIAPGGVAAAEPSEMFRRLQAGEAIPLVAANAEEYDRLLDFVFAERPFIPGPMKRVLVKEAVDHRAQNLRIWDQMNRSLETAPLEQTVNGLAVPTLIVWGAQDRVLHVSGGGALAAVMPNARSAVMTAVGHLPMIEKPGETARLYLKFLGLD